MEEFFVTNELKIVRDYYFHSMLNEHDDNLYTYFPTVDKLLDFSLQHHAQRPAFSDGTTTYTFQEVCDRVAQRRGMLKSLNLEKGSKIAVWSPNTVEAMEIYLAIVTAGFVSVMVSPLNNGKTVKDICAKFDVSVLFYDKSLEAGLEKPKNVICVDTEFKPFEPVGFANLKKEDYCSICLTGGTTGTPKGVILNQGAIMRGTYNACFAPGGNFGSDRTIAILPFSHIFGLISGFLKGFYTGALVYSCDNIMQIFSKIPVYKPTYLYLVPGMANILVNLSRRYGNEFCSSIKSMILGAALVPPTLMNALRDLGITVCLGYGLTESSNLTTANKNSFENPYSVGMVYPEQEYKIVNGELLLKGDNIMVGYYNEPELTKEVFDEDGWFRTGDLVRMDKNGFIYIEGRIKNLIILDNGENVCPEKIEGVFYKNKFVKDCLVREDSKDGKQLISIEIIPADDIIEKPIEELEDFFNPIVDEVNATLLSYERIGLIKIRKEDFKRTASLKIART